VRPRLEVALPAALHLAAALLCRFVFGVEIDSDPRLGWDSFWQTVPLVALRDALLENVLTLHGQPPLHNLGVGLLAKLSAQPLQLLHAIHIVMGAAMCAMASAIAQSASSSSLLGLGVGCLLALHPALLLYEAYPLYTLSTAFWIATALFAVSRFQVDRRDSWLLLFVLALTLLVLTRALYHVVLLVLCIAIATWLAGNRRRVLVLSLLIAMPAAGFSGRNFVVHGAPGGSTWAGCNLWKIASAGHKDETLRTLARPGGPISPVVLRVPVFSPPAAYRVFGFNRSSDAAALSRNDHHNVNIPEICALYGGAALKLMAHDPVQYAGNVWRAYRQFSLPSSGHGHLRVNAEKIAPWTSLSKLGPLFLGLVPLAMALPFFSLRHAGGWATSLRTQPLLPMAALFIAYTAAVACVADLGENERFKFPIELPVLCVLGSASFSLWQGQRAHSLSRTSNPGEHG